jgi:hypothetical protein
VVKLGGGIGSERVMAGRDASGWRWKLAASWRPRGRLPVRTSPLSSPWVYCLVDAPNKEAAAAVHREAHGLLADEITEVREGQ